MEFQFSGKCVFAPKVLVCRRKIKCSEIFFRFNFARKKLISHENNTSAFNYSDEKMFLLSGIVNNVCLFFFFYMIDEIPAFFSNLDLGAQSKLAYAPLMLNNI